MRCPVCEREMAKEDFGGVTVDVCMSGCRSLWFDWMELTRLDEKDEGFGAALTAALNAPRRNDENREKLKCPLCGIPMMKHLHQRSKIVTVNECPACGGFFLDSGELRAIRDTYMSDEERVRYVDKIISETPEFREYAGRIEAVKADLEKKKARENSLKKLFNGLLNMGISG
ncbi:MAG: zf-TFIIB domain-containing protein [bacterium]